MTSAFLNLARLFSLSWFVVPSSPACAVGFGVLIARTSTQGFSPVLL